MFEMKGIVFTQFLDFVADTWGVETANDVIEGCDHRPAHLFANAMTPGPDPHVKLMIGLRS